MRPLRIKNCEDEAGYFHLIARCAEKRFYFESADERDRVRFWLAKAVAFCGVDLYAWCIMSNHVHLLVKVPPKRDVSDAELDERMRSFYTPKRYAEIIEQWNIWRRIDGNESRVDEAKRRLRNRFADVSWFMKTFKQCVAEDYNARHDHTGSVWGGARFKSVYLDGSEKVLKTVTTYIFTNPVRAGMVATAGEYRWSGYGAALRGDATARNELTTLCADMSGEEWTWAEAQRKLDTLMNAPTERSSALSGLLIVASSSEFVESLFLRMRDLGERFFTRRKRRRAQAFEQTRNLFGLGGALRTIKQKVA